MSFIAKEWDIFVTKNGGRYSKSYDLVAFNPITETAYIDVVDESMLTGIDSKGNEYKMLEISRDTFNIIEDKMLNKYSLYDGFVYHEFNAKQTNVEEKEAIVPASLVKKGINGELSYEELDKIVSVDVEEGDYYNYNAFMEGILRFLRGEVSKNYYKAWTILVSWALSANKLKLYSKKWKIYDSLAYDFDGHSFNNFNNLEEKEIECNDMIATIKYKNHLLENVNKSKVPPFYNENKTIVYVNFAFCNQSNVFHRVCIANEDAKTFKLALVTNCNFLPNVNYTFIDEDEALNLSNTYYEYTFDLSINEHEYIASLPFKE